MRVTSRHLPRAIPAASAERVLGREHPLARAADRRKSLRRQLTAVALVLLGGVAAQLTGLASLRSLITVAVMVEATLGCSLLLAVWDERRQARELIINGRDSLPLPAVAWERNHLLDPGCRYRLARSLDRIVETTERRRWLLRGSRPLFRMGVVAAVAPQLSELAAALRDADCKPAGVAMTRRLLCDGESPLYGDDVALLREALRQICSRLNG